MYLFVQIIWQPTCSLASKVCDVTFQSGSDISHRGRVSQWAYQVSIHRCNTFSYMYVPDTPVITFCVSVTLLDIRYISSVTYKITQHYLAYTEWRIFVLKKGCKLSKKGCKLSKKGCKLSATCWSPQVLWQLSKGATEANLVQAIEQSIVGVRYGVPGRAFQSRIGQPLQEAWWIHSDKIASRNQIATSAGAGNRIKCFRLHWKGRQNSTHPRHMDRQAHALFHRDILSWTLCRSHSW